MTADEPIQPEPNVVPQQQNVWAPSTPPSAPVSTYAQPLQQQYGPGPIGKVRGTGVCILLSVVTLGIYNVVWYYQTHEEMKRHTGRGLGGGIALVLALFVGIVMPFFTSDEVGGMYALRGQPRPVSGITGLWYFPGVFLLVGPLIWFVQTNGALNAYWRSLGAR